jgi:tripartite-type tricarboxylate transporter receptor subunit TctC
MKAAPYDPLKDFLPISNMASVPNVVSVHPSVPARDMAEFIALARNPRSYLDYGSPGIGSLGNMLGKLFKQVANGYMTHIPYRGAGPALQDALADQIKVLFDNLPASLPHIKAGRLRALVVAWPSRLKQLPEIPTFAEVNLPALNDSSWFGLVAPVGTATDVIQRIQAATADTVSRPDVKMRIQDLGGFALGSTAESFEATLRAEFKNGKKVAGTGQISLENS